MRRFALRLLSSSLVLLVVACSPSATQLASPTALPPTAPAIPTPIATPAPLATPTLPKPTATAQPTTLKTFHAGISFETYEAEETVSLELGRLPGVASVNVTQLDVTVQYDPARLSEEDILRTLRDNPEVRIKDDNAGH